MYGGSLIGFKSGMDLQVCDNNCKWCKLAVTMSNNVAQMRYSCPNRVETLFVMVPQIGKMSTINDVKQQETLTILKTSGIDDFFAKSSHSKLGND